MSKSSKNKISSSFILFLTCGAIIYWMNFLAMTILLQANSSPSTIRIDDYTMTNNSGNTTTTTVLMTSMRSTTYTKDPLSHLSSSSRLYNTRSSRIHSRQLFTEAGVDISDARLYEDGMDYHGDSSTATVMGMATGYDLEVYQRFVGTLRKTGYQGHIILGVAPDTSSQILDYLKYRNVTIHKLQYVPCTYDNTTNCVYPYVNIKPRWSRFPLQKDWLEACQTCQGPILTMDIRDSFFQLDPFGVGSPIVQGLFVMEEHVTQRTTHWLTDVPLRKCKKIMHMNETMLCSGTTIGTRIAMTTYFHVMHAEMQRWSPNPNCHFGFQGDDQAIHNYLYYTNQLPFAQAWSNRGGGIVHTIGIEASRIQKQHIQKLRKNNPKLTKGQARNIPFEGSNVEEKLLLGRDKYQLTNAKGWFTELDGSTSRVIHQWDRFGPNVYDWLKQLDWVHDPFPPPSSYNAII